MNTATQLLERCKNYIKEYAGVHLRAQLLKDIEAYLAKQQVEQEPVGYVNLDGEFVATSPTVQKHGLDCGKNLYTQYSGALIVHKGCKATWANGVIEVMPVVREPAPLGAPMFWHAPPGAFMPAKQQTNLSK